MLVRDGKKYLNVEGTKLVISNKTIMAQIKQGAWIIVSVLVRKHTFDGLQFELI